MYHEYSFTHTALYITYFVCLLLSEDAEIVYYSMFIFLTVLNSDVQVIGILI